MSTQKMHDNNNLENVEKSNHMVEDDANNVEFAQETKETVQEKSQEKLGESAIRTHSAHEDFKPTESKKGFKPGNTAWKNRENIGRPKNRENLSLFIQKALERGDTKKKLADKIIAMALDGNAQALKLLMERTEGLVSQKVEISGPNGQPLMPAVLVLPSNGSEVMPALPPQYIDAEFDDDENDEAQEENEEVG